MLMIAAQSASSSSNLQMWSAVAVEDGARKARLADAAGQQNFIKQAPLFLIFLADMAMLADVAKGRQQALDGIDYLDTFLVAAFDAVLAAQNALIAAESMGLGAVFIGAIRNQPEKVIAELRLPEHVFPIVGLCVGVPDLTRRKSSRVCRFPPYCIENNTIRNSTLTVSPYTMKSCAIFTAPIEMMVSAGQSKP